MSEATTPVTHELMGFPIVHAGLTAEVYVIRDDEFLVLTRAHGGSGGGLDYIPGGIVERGEDPEVAAVRETLEECDLQVDVRLLRVWTWPTPQGWETIHATYVADAPSDAEVTLSDEHTAHRWVKPGDYIDAFCSEAIEAVFPSMAPFFFNVRRNCLLVADLMADRDRSHGSAGGAARVP
jgi:8-oxo-dGTP pyrophosphatase MutT (NUDIX family)